MGLAEREAAFARLGTRIYGLSLEPAGAMRELQERLGSGVTLLSDPTGEAAEAFGVRDLQPFPARAAARAATFFIDREGRVRRRWIADSYRHRPDPDEILAAVAR